MKEWSTTGIHISRDNKLQNITQKSSRKMLFLLRGLCLIICIMGALQMTMESYSLELNMHWILLGLVVDCLFFGIGWTGRGRWRLIQYLWSAIVFLMGIFQWEKVLNGYLVVENAVRSQLDTYYGINLPLKNLYLDTENSELFVFLIITIILLVLGNQVVNQGHIFMLTLFISLLFTLELMCGNRYQGIGIYMIVGSILALLAMKYRKGSHNQKILVQAGLWAAGVILILSMFSGMVAAPVLYENAVDVNMKVYTSINQTIDKVKAVMNSQNGIFGNHTPTADGSLSNNPVHQDEEKDLIVTVDQKPEQTIYLRGFIGDTYEETYWHRSNEKDFKSSFPQEDAAYMVQNIFYRYIQSQAEEEENTITVERLHPGGEYGYIPYGFETPNDQNLYGDTYYSSAAEKNTFIGYLNWNKWYNSLPALEAESDLEKQYKEYAADQYLKIPVNGLERLKSYCARQNPQSVQDAIDFVVQDVQEGRTYSMDLDAVPDGKNFVEYFFFEQKEGYCIHYATTATLMFRLLGVPARYVTGYMVTPESFVQDGDVFVAEVPDTRAHAWVEIYRLGKGWIPLEVTPGYGNGSSNIDSSAENLPETEEEQLTPTEESVQIEDEEVPLDDMQITVTPEPSEEMEVEGIFEQQNTNVSFIKKILLALLKLAAIVLGIILIVIATVLGARTYRKYVLGKRKKLFFQKNINQGICEISYGLHQLLMDAQRKELLGDIMIPENAKDIVYAKQMEEKLECVKDGEYVAFVNIVQKAAFGHERLQVEDRKKCYGFYRKIAREMWKKMNKKDKIWWKYVKCYEIPNA